MRDDLSNGLEQFEGRILSLSRQTPGWSILSPERVRALFALPIEGDLEEARLGPRAVAVVAAELEEFAETWLAKSSDGGSFDAEQHRDFSDDAHEFIETLEVIEANTIQCSEEAHRKLDDWRDSSLTELNELRESDIEAIQEMIDAGDIDTGHDARAERATVWEEQRERAATLSDFTRALHDLIEAGRRDTLDGLRRLADIFERICDALEAEHPELGDYRPVDSTSLAALEEDVGDTIVAPTDVLDDAVDASSDQTTGTDSESGSAPEPETPESTNSTEPEEPDDTTHLVRSDASSSSSRPFLRTPPPESDGDAGNPQERRTPTREHSDTAREDLPRRHDSTFIDMDGESEDWRSGTGHGLGLENSSDVQSEQEGAEQPESDTSSSLHVQVDQATTPKADTNRQSNTSESGQFVRGEDAPSSEDLAAVESPLEDHSSTDEPRSDSRIEDQHVSESTDHDRTDAPPPLDSPVAGRCSRFHSEWRRVPAASVAAALSIPAALVVFVALTGIGSTLGLTPNPLQTWTWLEPAAAVALLWLAAAPPLLGWRVRWDGWSCQLLRHVELRREGRLRLDTDGLLLDRISLGWRQIHVANVHRFETPDGDFGWLLLIENTVADDIAIVAPADSTDDWQSDDAPIRQPPQDAWQTDAETFHHLARFLSDHRS